MERLDQSTRPVQTSQPAARQDSLTDKPGKNTNLVPVQFSSCESWSLRPYRPETASNSPFARRVWACANDLLPYVDWRTHPVYCALLMVGILLIRQAHFYWTHRLTHWKPLYKAAHYLHHKNINIGPWSGLSMHPIEHLLYLSGIFVYWIIPSHPLHAVFHLMHAGLSPAKSHAGFYKFVLSDDKLTEQERAVKAGGYFHYLHHKYFTVNYGNEGVPLDQWFGSFHDGSPEAHAAMMARRRR